ncbi:hypothetical protein [Veillonella criceti]|uniref:Uncharacterized protein n=1 Tax=Veillonella criceti TaxID=103891 RepID=A0A380NL03_9FIRM|nr:hypothetical protein [Veillonella criceti]SUP42244.1 Uncharacterised protein [Veillonella criceti]
MHKNETNIDFIKRYDVISRKVFVQIGGSEHALLFTLQGMLELEAFTGLNIIELAGAGQTPNLTILTKAFCIGLNGAKGGNAIEESVASSICAGFLKRYGIPGLINLFFALIGTSGLLGPKGSNELLNKIGLSVLDPKESSVKNEVQVKQKKK